MPKTSSMSRVLPASLMVMFVLGPAWAQQSPTVRIRGTIEAVDGSLIAVKSREGTEMKVRLTDNVAVFGVAKTAISEIKPGSYIGVSAMPEPDGSQRALAVQIFPESQRGVAEAAGYAGRQLRRRRQVRAEAGRQDHYLQRHPER